MQVSNFFSPTEKAKQEGLNAYLTDKNAERLANALCRMRGAALKLGQMLSIQDEGVLPPQVKLDLTRTARQRGTTKHILYIEYWLCGFGQACLAALGGARCINTTYTFSGDDSTFRHLCICAWKRLSHAQNV